MQEVIKLRQRIKELWNTPSETAAQKNGSVRYYRLLQRAKMTINDDMEGFKQHGMLRVFEERIQNTKEDIEAAEKLLPDLINL